MEYSYLDTDGKIEEAVAAFSGRERIAVDFEGEFNLHVYGEHLCLVQIFDGQSFFIIDPRSGRVTPKGLEAFFSSPVRKVWFDCQSDASLVSKAYGLSISSIFDVRVLAEALGSHGNLKSVEAQYLGIESAIPKKRNQQANWMRRPIPPEQIEYALEDVAHLLELEDALKPIIEERGLSRQAEAAMKKATIVSKPQPGWTKVGGWKRMSQEERIYAKHIFLARDRIARRFNVPAARVMDKHQIPALAKDRPSTRDRLAARLSGESPRFMSMLIPAVWDAIAEARAEVERKGCRPF